MRTYAIFCCGVTFCPFFSLNAQTDPCEHLQPIEAFVAPYDLERIHLASKNDSMEEFFSYPSWQMVDASGQMLAEETLNYFGLVDTTWHVLNVQAPIPFNESQIPVSLVMTWNSIEGPQTCTYNYVFEPWMPFDNEMSGCMSVLLQVSGTMTPGVGWEIGLTDAETGVVIVNETVLANEQGVFSTGAIDALCLDLEACYELTWAPLGQADEFGQAYISLQPSGWGSAFWFNHIFQPLTSNVSGHLILDAYEPSCETNTYTPSVSEELVAWDARNPISIRDVVPKPWRGAKVVGVDGRVFGIISPDGQWPSGTSGLVVLHHFGQGMARATRVYVETF